MARTDAADIVRAGEVITWLANRRLAYGKVGQSALYASKGRDMAHPTKGHALLGALAARHVARRLLTEVKMYRTKMQKYVA